MNQTRGASTGSFRKLKIIFDKLVRRVQPDKQLRTDFAWVLPGNALYSACQWGLVVVLAKLGSPERVGEYALGMAVCGPIILFANLQLRALIASEPDGRLSLGHYLAFRLASLGAALLLIAVAAAAQRDAQLAAITILVGFAQALECVSDVYYGFMQKHARMDRIAISLILKGPLSLAALAAAMYATGSTFWAIVGLILGRSGILIAWDARTGFLRPGGGRTPPRSVNRLQWENGAIRELLRASLPLGFILMLTALNSSVPRYFLEAHAGSAELGIFSALASLLTAGSLVVSAFGQCIFVPVTRACAAGDRAKLRNYVIGTALMGSVLGLGGILVAAFFGRQILTQVFRPEYAEHSAILVRLAVAGTITFIASGWGYVLTAARCLNPQIPVLLAAALAAAATAAWSIPGRGLDGAVDAVLAAALVQFAGTLIILRNVDRRLRPADHTAAGALVTAALQSQETT